MRILIISSYRCGGNSFMYWISRELNLKHVSEPYNKDYNKVKDLSLDNIVVKMPYTDFSFVESFDNFVNSYDKVLAIIREDVRAACESGVIVKHLELEGDNFIGRIPMHGIDIWRSNYYVDEDFIKKYDEEITYHMDWYKRTNEEIKKLNILQVTYENIFIKKMDVDKVINYLDIKNPKHLNILEYKYKYRKDSEERVKETNVFELDRRTRLI